MKIVKKEPCRICWDEGYVFYRPCLCKGKIHKKCLDEWKTVSPNPTQCEICKGDYKDPYKHIWISFMIIINIIISIGYDYSDNSINFINISIIPIILAMTFIILVCMSLFFMNNISFTKTYIRYYEVGPLTILFSLASQCVGFILANIKGYNLSGLSIATYSIGILTIYSIIIIIIILTIIIIRCTSVTEMNNSQREIELDANHRRRRRNNI